MPDKPWIDAIVQVLQESNQSLSYTDIADRVVQQGLRENVGATPANTVNSYIIKSINEGSKLFVRTGRGIYWLSEKINAEENNNSPLSDLEDATNDGEDAQNSTGLINAFGMFWERNWITWSTTPKLLGQQQIGALSVDFFKQIGVYLLYDGSKVVYVGRVIDQPLGRRLFQHTRDRLQGRWNRFSWFGLYPLKEDAENTNVEINDNYQANFDTSVLIETLEALLIEGLEPPQNRRRGDNFKATEFLQVRDPEINRLQVMRYLSAMSDMIPQ
ncbi:HTH domain-containing protein [Komagataeibacter diospyri]|uniref:HTH domain-containing protein n=1 Tax=Komagataeibacter diospyri TaxID=1932662 RepID=UPI003756CA07